MLRQALVDAEIANRRPPPQQQHQQQEPQPPTTTTTLNDQTSLTVAAVVVVPNQAGGDRSSSSSLLSYHNEYGATTTTTPSIASQDGMTELQSSVQSGSYFEDEEEYDDDEEEDDDDEEEEEEEVTFSLPERIWNGIKTLVRVVANVENLWDSPSPPTSSAGYSYYCTQQQQQQERRRNQYIVLFWFVVLASSYAGERSTFKLLVDRAGPFRLFSVQVITVSHILIVGCALLVSYYTKRQYQRHPRHDNRTAVNGPIFMPLGIPLVDCILMAVLDTVTLVLVFLTGAHVPPTLTVILVQFTIPLTAFLTQLIHPDGKFQCGRTVPPSGNHHSTSPHSGGDSDPNDNEHSPLLMKGRGYDKDPSLDYHPPPESYRTGTIPAPPIPTTTSATTTTNDERLPGWGGLAAAHVWGSLILFVAVILALIPALYSIAHPDFFIYADAIPTRTAINTIFFVFSCFPAAASQLYKEHIFLQYRQPVNMGYLNLILSIFQFILVSVISPVAYGLQGLGFRGEWFKLYPASGTSDNFIDGLKCFFGVLDEDDQENKYPEDAECRLTLLLALLYVFSIITVGVSVDKIVNAGATKVMYRGISAGIIVAVLSMHYYDMHITDFSYGPAIDALNLVCLLLLVVGAEVYHRSSLQESTFETVYPVVMMPTFED